jgi:uncharacterized OB-fold protein
VPEIPYLVKIIISKFVKNAQLTGLGDRKVEIGMPVEMVTRKIRSDGDERGMLV